VPEAKLFFQEEFPEVCPAEVHYARDQRGIAPDPSQRLIEHVRVELESRYLEVFEVGLLVLQRRV
jgi:hypothetical protein